MAILRTLLLQASKSTWMRDRIPQFGFSRRAVARFMPGEKLEDALNAARSLHPAGIGTVFTYLGENVQDTAEASAVTKRYCDAISQIQKSGLDCEISIKPTQLGHDIQSDVSLANLETIVEQAKAAGNFVWIDMEDSNYTDSTLDLYRRIRERHANTGLCLQSYLYRTANDLKSLLPLSPAIRLVKGAYREPANRAFPRKQDVDANLLALAGQLLEAIGRNQTRVAFATHDAHMISRIQEMADAKGVAKNAYEFQMLYGIRSGAMNDLVRKGHRGRVLISYGPAWYAWYMRRLAERPANLLFVLKNVFSS
jgi:proline dehydrogenase